MIVLHPQTGERALSLPEAVQRVEQAHDALRKATERVMAAVEVENLAMNEMNKAQRAFDAAASDIRAEPAPNTIWHRAAIDRRVLNGAIEKDEAV